MKIQCHAQYDSQYSPSPEHAPLIFWVFTSTYVLQHFCILGPRLFHFFGGFWYSATTFRCTLFASCTTVSLTFVHNHHLTILDRGDKIGTRTFVVRLRFAPPTSNARYESNNDDLRNDESRRTRNSRNLYSNFTGSSSLLSGPNKGRARHHMSTMAKGFQSHTAARLGRGRYNHLNRGSRPSYSAV